jgi:hypothetical protein
MMTIGLVARHIYIKRNKTIETLQTIFNSATFNNIPIDIKWLKVLLNQIINSETERDGLKTSP